MNPCAASRAAGPSRPLRPLPPLLRLGLGSLLALALMAAQAMELEDAGGVDAAGAPTSASGAAPDVQPERTALREGRPPYGGLSIGVAFARADQDGDGQLSRQEAARLPVISMRFDDLDTDGSGTLNMMEFEAGALTPP